MTDRTTSALPLVTSIQATDFIDLVQNSSDVRITLDNLVDGLLPLSSTPTEIGAETNDAVNTGSGIGVFTGSKTGSQLQLKSILAGFGISVTDGGTTVVVSLNYQTAKRTIQTQVGTSYTYALADVGSYIRFTAATAIGVTVPPNSSVAFPVGSELHSIAAGAGQITINEGSGVTINHAGVGADPQTRTQYSAYTLVKVASPDTWDLHGDIAT